MAGKLRKDDGEGGDRPDGLLRLCAVSRTQKPPEELLRFVAGPDGVVTPDLARRLPGRGTWVDATRHAVATAIGRDVFARSLKQAVSVPDDLLELIDRLMVVRLSEALSIANKAGLLVTGFAKVEALIAGGKAVILIHAADGAEDGAGKLNRRFKALVGPEQATEATITEFAGLELDLAIGRSNVVHAATSEGGASQRILQEAKRLRRYRSSSEAPGHHVKRSTEPTHEAAQDVHERD